MESFGFLVKAIEKTLRTYPSVVLTSTNDSIVVCLFLIIERNLSVVKSIPWKFVKQTLPWVSSMINLNFLNESSLAFKSPNETSKTRPLRPSEAISYKKKLRLKTNNYFLIMWILLVPAVRLTGVLPICLVVNWAGAFTSYHSFLANGLILATKKIKISIVCIESKYNNQYEYLI